MPEAFLSLDLQFSVALNLLFGQKFVEEALLLRFLSNFDIDCLILNFALPVTQLGLHGLFERCLLLVLELLL